MPLISIIIPTYNRADLLPTAVESALAQSWPHCEIIIADDGSTDNTAEVVAQWGNQVRYLPLPHRGQPAATRNAGLAVAQGEFIAFLDSDDLFLPHKLATQAQLLLNFPEAAVAYGNGYFFQENPTQPEGHVLDGLPSPSGFVFGDLLRGNFLFLQTTLIRKTALDAVGIFDENPELFAIEDYDLLLRLAACYPFQYSTGDVCAIRRHTGGISHHFVPLKRRLVGLMAKIGRTQPTLVAANRAQWHEAHLRLHGALAVGEPRFGRWEAGFRHLLLASWHALHIPRRTFATAANWLRFRRLRRAARA
ncbi:MAG: glycosyltransferase [Chloroflexi bacterium]|nr:glycosyltransferase [Chloroflexota bacterium]